MRDGQNVQVSYGLAQEFSEIARRWQVDAFPDWLSRADVSGVPEVRRFVAGLRRDIKAVVGALWLPFSNGQVEGQINQLKMIKLEYTHNRFSRSFGEAGKGA